MPSALLLVAALAGCGFSLLGISYRLGERRGMAPCHVGLVVAVVGAIGFAAWAILAPPHVGGRRLGLGAVPVVVWGLGLVTGAGQGLCVALFPAATKIGPFSPVWCALNLAFVPAAGYAVGCLGERLGIVQIIGVAAAVLCVVVGSFAQQEPGLHAAGGRHHGVYAGLLVVFVVAGSLVTVALKYMEAHTLAGTDMRLAVFNTAFTTALYVGVGLVLAADAGRRSRPVARLGTVLAVGGLGAAGSMTGLACLGMAAALPGGIGFAISAAVTILGVAMASGFFFGEPRGRAWYAAVVLAVAAVVLFNTGG